MHTHGYPAKKSAYGHLKLPEKLKLEDSKSSKILHHAEWYIFTGILKHSASISSQSQTVNLTEIITLPEGGQFLM